MKDRGFHIIPYSEEYHDGVLQLEKGVIQGNHIQLEIIKKHFLDRAKVFKKYYSCIALTNEEQVIGSAIGAQIMITINAQTSSAGIGFDTKVDPAWRSKGVGRMLAKNLYNQFFQPHGLSRNFMTAKLSNAPVLKLASHVVYNTWLYEFVYLTIPTTNRTKQTIKRNEAQQLSIKLFNKDELSNAFYTSFDSGLGYFHTYKMYQLKIKKISWLYKQGISVVKKIQPGKYASLPGENETLTFATLYNHTPQNIGSINEVLEKLESNGIKQLLVCCRKKDAIYQFLKKFSINQYSYYLVADFRLDKHDEVIVDVRCL